MGDRKRIIIICAVVAALGAGAFYYVSRSAGNDVIVITAGDMAPSPPPETGGAEEGAYASPVSPATLFVHVAGEVNNPGVYELPEGSRVVDAVESAGGLTADAGTDVNLARALADGEMIVISKAGEEPPESGAAGEEALGEPEPGDPPVNINTATKEELMTLPGVGEVIAGGIIRHREKNGPFQSKESVRDVPRIGEKLYFELEDLITIE